MRPPDPGCNLIFRPSHQSRNSFFSFSLFGLSMPFQIVSPDLMINELLQEFTLMIVKLSTSGCKVNSLQNNRSWNVGIWLIIIINWWSRCNFFHPNLCPINSYYYLITFWNGSCNIVWPISLQFTINGNMNKYNYLVQSSQCGWVVQRHHCTNILNILLATRSVVIIGSIRFYWHSFRTGPTRPTSIHVL